MADNTRKTSNLVNTIPMSYDDSTVDQQPSRPIRGDLWFTSTTRIAKPKLAKTETKKRKPLKRITDIRPMVKQLRSKKNGN